MSGRLGIDFGTSNTVVALYDPARQEGLHLHLPDLGRFTLPNTPGLKPGQTDADRPDPISVVPSLVHYAANHQVWHGQQVHQQNLYDSERTFRWMKRYIANRSPVKLRFDGVEKTAFDAGRDFLSALITVLKTEIDLGDEEVAFTVPVEAYEHYENWLAGVAEQSQLARFRLIDEPSAAALGYGAHTQPGHVYLIFDFGGGTLDVSVVRLEEESAGPGRRCRVLGKAGVDLGGMTIDQWLFQEVLRRAGHNDSDEHIRPLSRQLLAECETAKEQLSQADRALIRAANTAAGLAVETEITRGEFEDLLDRHEAFNRMDRTIRRALHASQERGYGEDNIQAVLLMGGGSLIPSVQKTVQRIFGKDRVKLNRPLDAVARGAAAFVAGIDFFDHIQHDYGIRHVNPQTGQYDYRIIVKRGTPYPSQEPLARLTIKATYDRQIQLGLAIFELGEARSPESVQPVELVFDPSGAARLSEVTPDEQNRRTYFWINEQCPTFLTADPPARKGEKRFQIEFSVDTNKRLLITARDLANGRLTHREFPVVKLT